MTPAKLDADVAMALPCYDNPIPWQDDHRPAAQRWAQRQCMSRCAQVEWCAEQREQAIKDLGPHAGDGVWGGQIFSRRQGLSAA